MTPHWVSDFLHSWVLGTILATYSALLKLRAECAADFPLLLCERQTWFFSFKPPYCSEVPAPFHGQKRTIFSFLDFWCSLATSLTITHHRSYSQSRPSCANTLRTKNITSPDRPTQLFSATTPQLLEVTKVTAMTTCAIEAWCWHGTFSLISYLISHLISNTFSYLFSLTLNFLLFTAD